VNILPNYKLVITFSKIDSTEYKISYDLFDTPYISNWLTLWQTPSDKFDIDTWFVNNTWEDLQLMIDRCNIVISKINEMHNLSLPQLVQNNLSETLNYLHYEFEENFNKITEDTSLFVELNQHIHKIEHIISDNSNNYINFLSIIQRVDQNITIPLLPEYKLFASNYNAWGDLVLGYTTTGKNWCDALRDNDINLIKIHGISNKIDIQSEFYCIFFHDNNYNNLSHLNHVAANASLYSFYEKLDQDLKKNVPIGNLSEMSFGKLVLGHINYGDFFNNEPNIDFEQFNYNLKYRANTIEKWNTEVFSKFEKVINVEIINLTEETY
jgi:hypothetical protein